MSPQRRIGVYQPTSRHVRLREAVAATRAWILDILSTIVRRSCGLALLVLAGGLLAALVTFDSNDPSFDVATSREAVNWLGGLGSYSASLLYELMGLAALLLPLPLAAWSWRLLKGIAITDLRWQIGRAHV